jgi:hypothetical protein
VDFLLDTHPTDFLNKIKVAKAYYTNTGREVRFTHPDHPKNDMSMTATNMKGWVKNKAGE